MYGSRKNSLILHAYPCFYTLHVITQYRNKVYIANQKNFFIISATRSAARPSPNNLAS